MNRLIIIAIILTAVLPATPAGAQNTCFTLPASYPSDELRLAAVLMKPAGLGPFPALVFNHSSKYGRELQPTIEDGTPCFAVVSERGWVYFVPERRGYGRSEGPTLARAIGNRSGLLLLLAVRARARQEAGDILAGADFLRRRPFVDGSRIAAVGNAIGGLYTYLAASARPDAFQAIVLQGIDSGPYSELLLREMIRAARSITASILIQQARDGDPAPVQFAQDLAGALRRAGKDVTIRLYPGTHDLFASESLGPDGAWGKDLVEFLARQFAKPR